MREEYLSHHRPIIGIEIENHSPDVQSLTFMGPNHSRNKNKNLHVKNIISDTLYDDSSLTMLMNWITSVGAVSVNGVYFHSTLLYGGFNSKTFTISKTSTSGETQCNNFHLARYFSPFNYNESSIKIEVKFILDFFVEFSQRSIMPGEIMRICFQIENNKSMYVELNNSNAFDELVHDVELVHKDKKRKLLLLM